MVSKRTLFLLFLGLLGGSLTTGSSTTSSRGSGSTAARSDVGQEVLDIFALESASEELGPDRLNVRDVGGLDEGVKLVGLFAKEEKLADSSTFHVEK